jgi:predicted DNA binding CopG/RHH family protein
MICHRSFYTCRIVSYLIFIIAKLLFGDGESDRLLEDYDFSDGVRGRFYEPKKIPVTLRLDNDIVLYFKKLASEKKVPYQTLINALLRKKLQEV